MLSKFEMSDLGELNYFLGIQFSKTQYGTVMHQFRCLQELLIKFNMRKSNPTCTPTEVDLNFNVGLISKYMQDPKQSHMLAEYIVASDVACHAAWLGYVMKELKWTTDQQLIWPDIELLTEKVSTLKLVFTFCFAHIFTKALKRERYRFLRESIANAIKLHMEHCREALFEAAGISGDAVLNSCEEMEITNAIEFHMKHWRDAFSKDAAVNSEIMLLKNHWEEKVLKAYGNELYSRRTSDIERHLAHCASTLIEATDISTAFQPSFQKLQAYNRIDSLVECWRMALCEAAEIWRLVVQHYRGITDNEINYIEKRARDALREAAGISGVVILNSRNESEAVKNIVKSVTSLLDKTELFVANNPVGVESRVQEMVQLLEEKQSNDVLLLGIWGMGGIGKTTIAKAIYNKIGLNFEGRSFLADIREAWGQEAGHVCLQQQLLSDIHKGNNTKIHNSESGKFILRERLRRKRILVILDDVNELQQLNALCGNREWFGSGSRIIITTRDIHLLRGKRVDQVFAMTGMNVDESIELFSWHAFKQASPKEDFIDLSRNVVAYAGGLPLALEVLGSYLFGMEVTEWKSVLEKLRKIPDEKVQEKLKISYDGLSDDTEKGIFLDIACFFIGKDRNDVIHILNGCGHFAENGIRVLIDDKNQLGMHDLLRDMGREIIRSKSPMELEERSRLWFHEDVLDVLSKETGTKFIEGLTLKLPRTNTKSLFPKAFMNMKKLRLLQLSDVELVGDFEYLSKDLRWLCWHGFPLAFIPTSFYQGSLVSIELESSKITMVWKATQIPNKVVQLAGFVRRRVGMMEGRMNVVEGRNQRLTGKTR
ncbi:hypothetical protein V8G54_010044 [Vigna mungo]|uniref:AAA+ ATPase domain-containing protein n=1 Tax=Vigna mungo TaxID=3915 RepID=A0AAQ3NYC2_VIGMU